MSKTDKKIGLMVGSETRWPEAFLAEVNGRDSGVTAELVKIGGTRPHDACPYDVIFDRVSHLTPYYHVYLKFAALKGCYVVNHPAKLSLDDKFFGIALAARLGIKTPRSVVLPNKHVPELTTPESFRNLDYPLLWEELIQEVGVPAILKDVTTGGRRASFWVNTVDELIQCYDESDTATMLLQEIIPADVHVHCFVVGRQDVMALAYSASERRYLAEAPFANEAWVDEMKAAALAVCRGYEYDLNMVEFVVDDTDSPVLINPTNPMPEMNDHIMSAEQFEWCVTKTAEMAINLAMTSPAPAGNPLWNPED